MQYITESHQLERIIPELFKYNSHGVDTETTGLDPHVDKVTLLQIGRPEEQYVIDARKVSLEPLRPFLESKEIIKVLHNAKFDYKMLLGSAGIEMEGMRCTYLGEKVLNAGRKFRGFSLEDVLLARLGIQVDKSIRESFIGHTGDFSPEQLSYAGDDVKDLLPLCKNMVEEMRPLDLLNTFKLECDVVSSFGDMEFDGMLLDVAGWRSLIKKHGELAEEVKKQMDVMAEPFVGSDLFGNVDINYGSPAQMVKLLNMMHIKVMDTDPETGEDVLGPVKKTDKKTFQKLRDIPFIKMLQKWRGYQIRINTFGQPYIDAISPVTGRIHPNLGQLDTATGRPAAGESDVNPLNIPRDNIFRHCFICYPDEVVESDDYSGCESRILAEISGDPKLIDIFRRGEDIHCAVATDLYGKPVTKSNENSTLRTPAKSLNFGK